VENAERIVVGVNRYHMDEPSFEDILRINPQVEKNQLERLDRTREDRDKEAVRSALNDLERAAASDENIMPPIIQAAREYATLGEIADSLRKVFGEYKEQVVI
jgi:methylmalonyl-CoA mutase N-terminal domain/subunit